MIEKVLGWLQIPGIGIIAVFFMFLCHAVYMKYLFNHFRRWVYLDVIDFLSTRNNQEDSIEKDLNDRLQALRNASFAPQVSPAPYIKLVPNPQKGD